MSQSVNLFQITTEEFKKFAENNISYQFNFEDESSAVFDQNFEGLNFIYSRYFSDKLPELLKVLFEPKNYIGKEIDYDKIDFDNLEDFPESNATYYLNPIEIQKIFNVIKTIKNDEIIKYYDSEIFNQNDIYPSVWHNDESEDQAFNKNHLIDGLNLLQETFRVAENNENYILYFVG